MELVMYERLQFEDLTDIEQLYELRRRNLKIDDLCTQARTSQDYDTLRNLHIEMVANKIRIAALEDHILRN